MQKDLNEITKELISFLSNDNKDGFISVWNSLSDEEKKKAAFLEDSRGYNLLHSAAWQGNTEIFNSVWNSLSGEEKKKAAFLEDSDGNSLLHSAAWQGNTEIFNSLWNSLSDEEKKKAAFLENSSNNSLLHYAVSRGNTEIFHSVWNILSDEEKKEAALLKNSLGNNLLHNAAWQGNTEIFTSIWSMLSNEKKEANFVEVVKKHGNLPDMINEIAETVIYPLLHLSFYIKNDNSYKNLLYLSKNITRKILLDSHKNDPVTIFKLSDTWHDHGITPLTIRDKLPKRTWKGLFSDDEQEFILNHNGTDYKFLPRTNSIELEELGHNMKNCSATWDTRCADGEAYVILMQKKEGNEWRGVTTLQLDIDNSGKITIGQNVRRANKIAGAEENEAAEQFVKMLNNGQISANKKWGETKESQEIIRNTQLSEAEKIAGFTPSVDKILEVIRHYIHHSSFKVVETGQSMSVDNALVESIVNGKKNKLNGDPPSVSVTPIKTIFGDNVLVDIKMPKKRDGRENVGDNDIPKLTPQLPRLIHSLSQQHQHPEDALKLLVKRIADIVKKDREKYGLINPESLEVSLKRLFDENKRPTQLRNTSYSPSGTRSL